MNKLAIAQELAVLPDGVMIEQRRQRITAQLGLATGLIVPLSGSELPPGEQRNYFYANVEEVQSVLGQINECIPFAVDRAVEIGYRVWASRHELAFRPRAADLFTGDCFAEVAPEVRELKVVAMDVDRAVALIREGLAV
ncbi:hypothetical protein D3C85_512950 [compost metagenome]